MSGRGRVPGLIAAVLFLLAAATFPFAVSRVFLHTPIERAMGTVQKIFYFHVPLAWTMMLFAVLCGVAAGFQLWRGSRRGEALSIAAAELVLITGAGVLITGPIWGHATWGTPWTWDARQVTTALLWLVFAAFVLLRRYGAAGSERLAAGLAIFGAVDVPVIYRAVAIWKTTHPKTDVVGTLPPGLWAALWLCLVPILALCIALLLLRTLLELAELDADDAWLQRHHST
jgi:heme exporter protein C